MNMMIAIRKGKGHSHLYYIWYYPSLGCTVCEVLSHKTLHMANARRIERGTVVATKQGLAILMVEVRSRGCYLCNMVSSNITCRAWRAQLS